MSTVTKRELARQVAAHAFCSYAQAQEMVDALFTGLREQLIEGHRIEVRGFGVLTVKDTKAKTAARNPRTGERVFVPARRKVLFKPGKQLKQALTQPTP
jgi:nucleoid DNA-binding protein